MSYRLHIQLKQQPSNERTIDIAEDCSFVDLAHTICTLYGFDGEHLWEFTKKQELCINHPEISVDSLPNTSLLFADEPELNDPELLEDIDNTTQVSATNYTLKQYFATEEQIIFSYDFLAERRFTISKQKRKESIENSKKQKIVLVAGQGNYLLEDSGGRDGLQEQLALYKKKKFDEDARETREDFTEWIAPALTKFDAQSSVIKQNKNL